MAMAYKYGEPDRPLNVVILSDGMTEQRERSELLSLIDAWPANARVFCIGVGNEVNRPLLSQLAEETGGLAAFLSHRRRFRPAGQRLRLKRCAPRPTTRIDVEGVEVYDVEPRKLPSLYHGMPVRLYGRYRKLGVAKIRVRRRSTRGDRPGRGFQVSRCRTGQPGDPADGLARVDQLLKEADRTGSRSAVTDEIVRLGETYSIVTEYTSFIVLETTPSISGGRSTGATSRGLGGIESSKRPFRPNWRLCVKRPCRSGAHVDHSRRRPPANRQPTRRMQPQVAQRAAQPNTTGRDLDFLPRPSGGGGSVEWLFLAGLGMLGFGGWSAALGKSWRWAVGSRQLGGPSCCEYPSGRRMMVGRRSETVTVSDPWWRSCRWTLGLTVVLVGLNPGCLPASRRLLNLIAALQFDRQAILDGQLVAAAHRQPRPLEQGTFSARWRLSSSASSTSQNGRVYPWLLLAAGPAVTPAC